MLWLAIRANTAGRRPVLAVLFIVVMFSDMIFATAVHPIIMFAKYLTFRPPRWRC